jgi:hypothetical protein
LHRTGALDDLAELYPASDAEALAPRALDKWIALEWLYQCYREGRPLAPRPAGAPALPGLNVYVVPQAGRAYAIGADPAEGNPTSNDSALAVLDRATGEEVASLRALVIDGSALCRNTRTERQASRTLNHDQTVRGENHFSSLVMDELGPASAEQRSQAQILQLLIIADREPEPPAGLPSSGPIRTGLSRASN